VLAALALLSPCIPFCSNSGGTVPAKHGDPLPSTVSHAYNPTPIAKAVPQGALGRRSGGGSGGSGRAILADQLGCRRWPR